MKLISLVLLFFVLSSSGAQAFEKPLKPLQREVTFEEVAQFVLQLDAMYDALPADAFPVIDDIGDARVWEQEIVPFFAYEGVVMKTREDATPQYRFPRIVSAPFNENEIDFEHLLGTTDCLSGEITLNERVFRSISAWYNRPDLLVVITHELAHAQGVCFGPSYKYNSEVSAQLVTLEVLAAMTNRGNPYTLGPMLDELRYMALASSEYLAMKNDDMASYEHLLDQVATKQERAKIDKSLRFWANDPEHLQYILENYNYVPVREIMIALKNQSCTYTDISVTEKAELVHTITTLHQPCISGLWLPANWGIFHKPLVIDDLAYILEGA